MGAVEHTLETVIGYSFRDSSLLRRALTHRSWVSDNKISDNKISNQNGSLNDRAAQLGDNEQLEFLGDAVLGFVVSQTLFLAHPEASEGQLTQSRAQLICGSHLSACAMRMGIGEFLYLGRSVDRNGIREKRRLLANSMEAIIAAIFLDGGIDAARTFINRHVISETALSSDIATLSILDSKGVLQEQAQARGLPLPTYVVTATSGPGHARIFTVEARIGDEFSSRATASSKKAASQGAAQSLIDALQATGWKSAST